MPELAKIVVLLATSVVTVAVNPEIPANLASKVVLASVAAPLGMPVVLTEVVAMASVSVDSSTAHARRTAVVTAKHVAMAAAAAQAAAANVVPDLSAALIQTNVLSWSRVVSSGKLAVTSTLAPAVDSSISARRTYV